MAKTVTERYCPTGRLPVGMTEAAARRAGWEWAVDRNGKKWFCPACAARRRGSTGVGPCKSSPVVKEQFQDHKATISQKKGASR
jgi:hypothetical protein